MEDALLFGATVVGGSLAGMELASWAVVHPAMWQLEHIEQVHAEKALYRRFGMIQAPQSAAAVALCAAATAATEGPARTLAGVATGCFAAMLVVTFAGNMPVKRHPALARAWRPSPLEAAPPPLGPHSYGPDPA